MKSVTIFNNKGGVGKTTLLCNLASFLSKKYELKIAVVDADPQCNSTIYMCPPETIQRLYSSDSTTGTIYDIIKPLSLGEGYTKNLPIVKNDRFGIDLIPGDPRLSLMEDLLSSDWKETMQGNGRGIKTSLLFYEIVQKLANQKYDYVFFDLGPSLGALNRAVILATNYFVIPVGSDIFSIRAIENIGISLDKWTAGIKEGLKKYKQEEFHDYKINNKKVIIAPKCAGYVIQQYAAKSKEGNRIAVKAFDEIIQRIPKTIDINLSKYLKGKAKKIGEIPTLQSIIPLSQSANAPIFDLRGKDGVVGSHFNSVKSYNDIIQAISEKFLESTK